MPATRARTPAATTNTTVDHTRPPADRIAAVTGATSGIGAATAAETAEWDRMLDLNVGGLLRTRRAFADDLLAAASEGDRAELVHVGSVGGHSSAAFTTSVGRTPRR